MKRPDRRRGRHPDAPNGDVLLGQRPEGKPYAGYWEFPGGKVEPGEDDLRTRCSASSSRSWACTSSAPSPGAASNTSIEHAHVRLHFYISREWEGEPQSLEGQAFAWQGGYSRQPAAAGHHPAAGVAGPGACPNRELLLQSRLCRFAEGFCCENHRLG
jgi:8-oxo-dGTP diphosphatase